MDDLIILGGGGHARVLCAALSLGGAAVRGYLAPEAGPLSAVVPHLGDDDELDGLDPDAIRVVNGLGSVGSTAARRGLHERVRAKGFRFAEVLHPRALIDPAATIGPGAQVLAGAIVNVGAVIEQNALVNSGAVVEHDAVVGAHAHVSPGAVLAGGVRLGEGVHVGLGARVIQDVTIGSGSIVGAGAVVIHDVPDGVTIVGVPARARPDARGERS